MIQEDAYVAEVENGRVWVEKARKSACSGCAEACPSSLASNVLSGKSVRLSVRTDLPLRPGDKIVIGLAEDSLAKGSVLIYLVPLVGFFTGAWLGKSIFESDLVTALAGLGGLTLCYLGFKLVRLFDSEGYQPVILRKFD